MKKNVLFDNLQAYIRGDAQYYLETERYLQKAGIDTRKLWGDVDSLLMKIAEKHSNE